MENRSLAYASYWRNSLADAELGRGALKHRDISGLTRIPLRELFNGVMPAHLVRDPMHVARTEDGQRPNNGIPEYLTPLVTPGLLARDGRLYPAAGTVIPRDLLEPLERGSFAIGSVTDLDTFLTTDAVPGIEWDADADEPLDPQGFEERWLLDIGPLLNQLDEEKKRNGASARTKPDLGSNTWDRDPSVAERKRRELHATVSALGAEKIHAVLVRKVHSKVVIGDENTYCVGSFNWFSARRDAAGARHETSLVYRGPHLTTEIKVMKESLQHRAAQFSH